MGKHTDALGSFDNFKAPWESESGGDAEIDKPKLKKLIFNVKQDYAKARDAHEDTKAELETATKDLETAKAEAADANGAEAQKKIDKLEAKVKDLQKKVDDREAQDEHDELRKDVIGDLDPKYAKYVVGEDREALEKSLEAVKADFGITDDGEDPENEEEEHVVRRTPRTLVNATDVKSGKPGEQEIDFDAVADSVVGNRLFN